ncbi:MAG: DUF4198 domain-containing protein [Syntrophobacteraceae bacterium]
MKRISYKAVLIGIASLSLLAVQASACHAHDTWVVMQEYAVGKSKPASLAVANAHRFVIPCDESMPRDRVEKVVFLTPDGKELPAAPQGDKLYQSGSLEAQGTYVAVVTPQNGFSSKTPAGYQRGKSKKDLKDVVECRCSEKHAKALFTVGGPGGDAFSRPLGHKMEIIPMNDPATLKEGDFLSVRVLIEGKPARTNLYGTYAGFSDESGTFCYTTRTDKEGVAKIRIIKAGTWLLLAKEEMHYPDTTVCDKLSYAASLTFQVK